MAFYFETEILLALTKAGSLLELPGVIFSVLQRGRWIHLEIRLSFMLRISVLSNVYKKISKNEYLE
jgi:hypothetical protein